MKLIKCDHTENIMMIIKENEDVSKKEIKANIVDASFEKHIPTYEFDNDNIIIKVNHVMTEEHYIEWIMLEGKNFNYIKKFEPGDDPVVVFPKDGVIKLYSYCNLHSLWTIDVK